MSRSVHTIFLRLKYLCSRYGKLAAIALVVLSSVALAGSAVAYTQPPETTQVTQQTDVQTFTTTVNTSAAVTGDTTLYDAERQLADMPVYLLAASPEMTLRAHAAVPDDRAVEVTQQVTMELYATRDDEVFWTETETLATDSQQVTDGSLVTETTVNVSDIRRGRLREVQPEVNNVGTLGAKFHVDTVYNTDKYQGHLAVTTPVEITDRAYSVETPQSVEKSHATPMTRTLTNTDDAITFGAPATANATTQAGLGAILSNGPTTVPRESAIRGGLGLLGLLIALVVWRVYSRNPGWEELKQSYDKARYGEWMSVGTVPTGEAYEHVAISGLTDLLDIAIDSNKRIIHDPDQARYAVVDGMVVYEYNEALDQIQRYVDLSAKDSPQFGSQQRSDFFASSATEDDTASAWDTIDDRDHSQPNTHNSLSSSDSSIHADDTVSANDSTVDPLSRIPSTDDPIDDSGWEMLQKAIDLPNDAEKQLDSPAETDTNDASRQSESRSHSSGSDNANTATEPLWGGLDGASESLD
jgi:hypothetical protein